MATTNGTRYDFRTQSAMLGALVERAKAEITEEQRITIQSACRNHRFCYRVQFAPFSREDQHVMTLGQLADLGFNDPGVQRIDPKAIERLLFGDYGMIRHKKNSDLAKDAVGKIAERPLIVYFQQDDDSAPEKPANASGRHRNYAWQILAAAADVEWDLVMEQPMWVDKTIARNKSEFTMMMTLANGQQSRKQPAVELKSYDLTKKMVSIDDLSNLVATRINATQGQFADVIATGASMSLPNSYTGDASYIWDRVKSSWTKAVRVSPSHKKALVEAFKLDGDTIKGLMQSIGQQAPDIIDEESERTSSKALNTRVTEKIADLICDHFNVERGAWPTDAEVTRKKLENLKVQEQQLNSLVG